MNAKEKSDAMRRQQQHMQIVMEAKVLAERQDPQTSGLQRISRKTPQPPRHIITTEPLNIYARATPSGGTFFFVDCADPLVSLRTIERHLRAKPELVNVCDYNQTPPLFPAIFNKRLDIVEVILRTQLYNINHQNYEGNTALHMAARNGCQNIVEYLLKQPDIDPTMKNNDYSTALDKYPLQLLVGHEESKEFFMEMFERTLPKVYTIYDVFVAINESKFIFVDALCKQLVNKFYYPNNSKFYLIELFFKLHRPHFISPFYLLFHDDFMRNKHFLSLYDKEKYVKDYLIEFRVQIVHTITRCQPNDGCYERILEIIKNINFDVIGYLPLFKCPTLIMFNRLQMQRYHQIYELALLRYDYRINLKKQLFGFLSTMHIRDEEHAHLQIKLLATMTSVIGISCTMDCRRLTKTIYDVLGLISVYDNHFIHKRVAPLKDQCRLKIRGIVFKQSMGDDRVFIESITSMEIPRALIDFLRFNYLF